MRSLVADDKCSRLWSICYLSLRTISVSGYGQYAISRCRCMLSLVADVCYLLLQTISVARCGRYALSLQTYVISCCRRELLHVMIDILSLVADERCSTLWSICYLLLQTKGVARYGLYASCLVRCRRMLSPVAAKRVSRYGRYAISCCGREVLHAKVKRREALHAMVSMLSFVADEKCCRYSTRTASLE